uniref:Asymmetric leaves 1 n=1 Tax=Nothotsuga longibracteata TaxID=123601 RepID=A0A8E4LYS0_9CONI|nr:asymmetric leaves 1 [Nothotsuga longibracteata]
MKERQRWRSEEDSLLHAYVKQYGPREWNLVSQRMNKALDRDPKSCAERWKNYLKPGIKKGSLSEDEQRLVISLQAKYGNRWKKIAAQVPGTTAKRLSKWWEVYREKQHKIKDRKERTVADSAITIEEGKYDHILETFAEKYMQRQKQLATPGSCNLPTIAAMPSGIPLPITFSMPTTSTPDFIHFAIPSASTPTTCSFGAPTPCIPPWMSNKPNSTHGPVTEAFLHSSPLSKSSPSSSSSPSVTLSLSPSSSTPVMSANTASACSSWMQDTAKQSSENNVSADSEAAKEKNRGNSHVEMPSMDPNKSASGHQDTADQGVIMQEIPVFFQHCRELEERQLSWSIHKKETAWRLKRLEQQFEAEKARKRREKMEEIESKVRALREEESLYLDRLESDYREQLSRIHRDAEIKDTRMMEMWTAKHVQLEKFFEQIVHRHDPHKSI